MKSGFVEQRVIEVLLVAEQLNFLMKNGVILNKEHPPICYIFIRTKMGNKSDLGNKSGEMEQIGK